jgi:hypothetical protein
MTIKVATEMKRKLRGPYYGYETAWELDMAMALQKALKWIESTHALFGLSDTATKRLPLVRQIRATLKGPPK